ncbi:MAG: hypothetical protein EXR07_14680 [Acetobacteraceae bacterium]|nr:hypothetical protein [Acetobacteraceae bacterium]
MSDDPILAAMGRLETGQTALRSDVTGLRADVTDLRTEVTGLRTEVTGLRDGQTALRTDMVDLRADVTDLRDGQTRLTADLTSLRTDLTALRDGQTTFRVDLMGRIERLENHITDIRDDIGVNIGRADRAHEAADNTRNEVRLMSQELSVMWRQIKRLESDVREIKGEAA